MHNFAIAGLIIKNFIPADSIRVILHYVAIVRKNWPYPPTAGGSYGRQGGRPEDKIRVDFEILKLLYRLNYSEFYFVYNITAILLQY